MKKIGFLPLCAMLLLTGCWGEGAGAIGVIGGADGPTAIFVTQKTGWLTAVLIALALIVVFLAVLWLVRRKK